MDFKTYFNIINLEKKSDVNTCETVHRNQPTSISENAKISRNTTFESLVVQRLSAPSEQNLYTDLHQEESKFIKIFVPYNSFAVNELRNLQNAYWFSKKQCWRVQNTPDNVEKIFTF